MGFRNVTFSVIFFNVDSNLVQLKISEAFQMLSVWHCHTQNIVSSLVYRDLQHV